jgi:predicted  nucleic acid-binding Zn-ribbon protein
VINAQPQPGWAASKETTLAQPPKTDRAGNESVEALRTEVEHLRKTVQDLAHRLSEVERRLAKLEPPASGTETLSAAELNASNDE